MHILSAKRALHLTLIVMPSQNLLPLFQLPATHCKLTTALHTLRLVLTILFIILKILLAKVDPPQVHILTQIFPNLLNTHIMAIKYINYNPKKDMLTKIIQHCQAILIQLSIHNLVFTH